MAVQTQTSIRIDFELDETDIAYFRERLEKARRTRKLRDDDRVILGAKALAVEAVKAHPPNFVLNRIEKLNTMLAMLGDHDWRLIGDDRERVMNALAYFADPNDLIPDDIPGIGFLDDAIMIELVAHELAPEMEAYKDFCANRDELASGHAEAEPVDKMRDELQARMRRRRRRRGGGSDGGSDVVSSLFHAG